MVFVRLQIIYLIDDKKLTYNNKDPQKSKFYEVTPRHIHHLRVEGVFVLKSDLYSCLTSTANVKATPDIQPHISNVPNSHDQLLFEILF